MPDMSTWETRDKLENHCRKHGDEVSAIRGYSSKINTKEYSSSCNQTVKESIVTLEYEDSEHGPRGKHNYSKKIRTYFDRNSLCTVENPTKKIFKTHFPNGCIGLVECRSYAQKSLDVKLARYKNKIQRWIDIGRIRPHTWSVKKAPNQWILHQN